MPWAESVQQNVSQPTMDRFRRGSPQGPDKLRDTHSKQAPEPALLVLTQIE